MQFLGGEHQQIFLTIKGTAMKVIQPLCYITMLLFFSFASIYAIAQPAYFGEQPSAGTATVFAKNIISSELYEHSAPAFSPDGKTVLWTIVEMHKPARIMEITMNGNKWSAPHQPSFADTAHDDFYPFFSYNGNQLIFSSRRPMPDGAAPKDIALWIVERKDNKWGKPVPFDTTVSKGFEYAHALSKKGNIFFSVREVIDGGGSWKICYATFNDGKYSTPLPLNSSINDGSYVDGPFIAPDESYLIFESDRDGGLGSIDLYICFKNKQGEWDAPKNMGAKINSTAAERFAGLSPDGKYFFFGSNRSSELPDIYWISSDVITELKKT